MIKLEATATTNTAITPHAHETGKVRFEYRELKKLLSFRLKGSCFRVKFPDDQQRAISHQEMVSVDFSRLDVLTTLHSRVVSQVFCISKPTCGHFRIECHQKHFCCHAGAQGGTRRVASHPPPDHIPPASSQTQTMPFAPSPRKFWKLTSAPARGSPRSRRKAGSVPRVSIRRSSDFLLQYLRKLSRVPVQLTYHSE